ncbi:SRPBCC domain-containing protein [Nocardia sp. NRRL S-836]|uniref:SRPBCC domain-containing protein n=1 Tax=Nocardia sp. NRRL S-836 TaxID=1519492 RepID=UPI0006AE9500|nr:SRPBCC domain-containing protein [Nocardia sp. NRRL S-836]KOV76654.1 ATPase [Nocardia sp. NRRL S-836]
MNLGTVTVEGDHAVLAFERRLGFPIDRVWSAITDDAERKAWFGNGTVDPHGKQVVIEPEDPPAPMEAKRVTGRILTWQPPENGHAVFEHEWHQRIVEDSVVRYELTADGDATVLRFTHRGLSERNAKGFAPGTHAFLDRAEAHLGHAPLPNWGERYAEVAPDYPAWR